MRAAATHSAIYHGSVRHRRWRPRRHAFRYRVFMLYLDLDEIDYVFKGVPLWSAHRPAPARWRRRDYLGPCELPLKEAVQRRIRELGGDPGDGPVRMLTNLRYFGYSMNPVTFYYCFGSDGITLRQVLAEVTNTPWGERHSYLIRGSDQRGRLRGEFAKQMHVSPFLPLEMRYRWNGNSPGAGLSVHMQNLDAAGTVTDATLNLKRRELTRRSLLSTLLAHPWMTAKVAAAIYFEALRLWCKGVGIHPHPRRDTTTETAVRGGARSPSNRELTP